MTEMTKSSSQESSQMTFSPGVVNKQSTVSTKVNTPGNSINSPASESPNGWHITIIVLVTCLVIAVFGLVVACTTWRCAYVHLERRNSERLACLAGVDMADSQWRLTMDPVYDVIPTNSRWWRKANRDHLTSTPTTP
ncbi:uncharacterized protein LOC112569216 [Pomacea canaliculata]|uniref:uncharacterized protein LOC112569216 n=1 Tax=Pomacea canaliculata TaxID=400727 RepID=UPI000D732EFE|nr:uncharacterized protein LOC112569216 [Pomacea canaliculata]